MVAHDLNSLCRQAELYYYDFLYDESHSLIPESIISHVEQCPYCQDQVHQLEVVLSQYKDMKPEESQAKAAITTMLRLHFAHIGKDVTCKIARLFLPALLDPALGIRIPTPITAHLDHCQQCAQDLETIRCLNLSRKQSYRLSQLFAAKPTDDSVSCSQAHTAIMAFVSMAFNETNEQVLKHLCTCFYCRQVLYQYRETVHTDYLREKGGQKCPLCDQVSIADIFDYVVPYGLDPAHDQYAKFRDSLTSHLRSCPVCLAKMQQLHNTVYGIIERAQSEIVTVYHVDESARAVGESDELYSGFPIKVDVLSPQHEIKAVQSTPTVNFADASKEKVSVLKRKPLVKTAFAAAAAVLIVAALLLFLNMPTAKAVTIDQIYKAIEKVQNVYISKFVPDDAEPTEEKWISRPLNIYMAKTAKDLVLWDIVNKVRKAKQLGTDSVETTMLSDDIIAEMERKISSSLGLMPFPDISDVPPDAEWSRVIRNDVELVPKGTEVYDLIWNDEGYDLVSSKKWRFFVDSETNLPNRIEVYRKTSLENKYILNLVIVVEYLSDSKMQAIIKKASF
jgi:hypothetical protein